MKGGRIVRGVLWRLLLMVELAGVTGVAQTDRWRSYLAYRNTTGVAEGGEYVFALADGALYSYGKSDGSINYYSKETGLSDNQIVAMGYNRTAGALVIVYSNGNIDLWDGSGVHNLPYLMNAGSVQDKTIYAIYNDGGIAYLCAAYGITALDVSAQEIRETYKPGGAVSSATIVGGELYALTSAGVVKGSLSDNLVDPGNWHEEAVTIGDGDSAEITQLCTFEGALCLLVKDRGVYYRGTTGDGFARLLDEPGLTGLKVENDKLFAYSPTELFIYTTFTERERGSVGGICDVACNNSDNTYWLATGEGALVGIKRTGEGQYETVVSGIVHNSPSRNLDAFMLLHDRMLYIAGGGRWTNRYWNPGTVMLFDTDNRWWLHYYELNSGYSDATSIAVDPADANHLFVSTWGEGVYEFKDGALVAHYNHTNSALNTIFPDEPQQYNYIRVEGLCFDSEGNLWMSNTDVKDAIVIRKPDNTWTSLYYEPISNATLADKILIAGNGLKWLNLARAEKSGIFVWNDGGTPYDTGDDAFHYYSFLSDTQGNIGATEYLCITEDREGAIWIGTNRGVLIVSDPSNATNGTMIGSRILQPNETGQQDYFLKDERITAIAVDGGNRKWLATATSGIYLLSRDGSTVIEHFTSDNSPLLSNVIQSLAIDHRSGEVFIGTDKGLISYQGDATEGSADYSNVYAFPNPVRPDLHDYVTITGLIENSLVKITDLKGNLIYQATSLGGQIIWNMRNRSGHPVASGIYLVLAATSNGKQSVLTKIAVIR